MMSLQVSPPSRVPSPRKIPKFLTADECEHFLATMEFEMHFRALERQLGRRKIMAFVAHARFCRLKNASFFNWMRARARL